MGIHELLVVLTYLSIAIMLVCCVVIFFHAESYLQKLTTVVAMTLAVASVGFLIRIEATRIEELIIGQKLIYAFVGHGVFAMTLFVYEYCGYKVPNYVRNGFIVVDSAVSLAAMTMNYHHMFYTSFEVIEEANGHLIGLQDNYGLFQIVAITCIVIYMCAATGAIITFAINNAKKRGKYVWRLAIVVALPCVVYSIPKLLGLPTDLQPIAFGIFMTALVTMVYQNKLYDTKDSAIVVEKKHSEFVDKQNQLLKNEVVELSGISYIDELTGIRNRRSYEETISSIQQEGNLAGIMVGVFDINGLKETNDTKGHAAGDELIKAVASIIDDVFGAEGQVFRTGGDEYVAIIRNHRLGMDKYAAFLDKRMKSWTGEQIDSLSFSYGFADGSQYPDKTLLQLVSIADKEMYRCKQNYYDSL